MMCYNELGRERRDRAHGSYLRKCYSTEALAGKRMKKGRQKRPLGAFQVRK